jgi:N-acetylmuramic acid 6-phosphate etherase
MVSLGLAICMSPNSLNENEVFANITRTDGDYDTSVNSMITAARKALQTLPQTTQAVNGINGSIQSSLALETNRDESFSSIWIASAGMDRPGMQERVRATVTQQLNLDKSVQVRVSNDVDLLAAAMVRHPEITSSLVVIAGTGSIAIRYALDSNDGAPKRIARAGGWGHLLGDEGAGYAIGRQAIRKTLCSLEEISLGQRKAGLSPLDMKVVEFFSGSPVGRESDVSNIDLLSNVLTASDEKTAKSRIASITQKVLDLAGAGNAEAVDIISQQVSGFVDNTVSRLLDPQSHGYVDLSRCGLILSGGVMLHSVYQTIFQLALAKHGIRFCYTEAVPNAAVVGVEYLLASEARAKLSNGVF